MTQKREGKALRRILIHSIDMNDPGIRAELDIDLRRMDLLPHDKAPENADVYRVTVTPSVKTYMPGLHRFRFEIQYGKLDGDKFTPVGEVIRYQTETLPFLG